MTDFRKYRQSMNMTQNEFAEACNMPIASLAGLEASNRKIRKVYRLAALYVISLYKGKLIYDNDVLPPRRYPKTIQSKLAKARYMANVSQLKFAELTGLSVRMIEDVEQGLRIERPIHTAAALYGVSKALGRVVSEDEL